MTEVGLKIGSSDMTLITKEIIVTEPSVVGLKVYGPVVRVVSFGSDAIELSQNDKNLIVFSPLMPCEIANEKYLAIFLKSFFKKYLSNKINSLCVVVAVNVSTPVLILDKIKKYLMQAGANIVKFVSNGTCARYDIPCRFENKANIAVDIGKYSLDITVSNKEKIICGRTYKLGGDNINLAIIAFVKDNYGLDIDDYVAENLKLKIGTLYDFNDEDLSFYGANNGKLKKVKVTSKSLRLAIMSTINEFIAVISEFYNVLDKNIKDEIFDNGIIFTGGTSKISGFLEYVSNKINIPIYMGASEFDSVILGLQKMLNTSEYVEIKY